jgi:hypothetical protein
MEDGNLFQLPFAIRRGNLIHQHALSLCGTKGKAGGVL